MVMVCTFAISQDFKSYSEMIGSGYNVPSNNDNNSGITIIQNVTGGGITTYTDQTDFEDAYSADCTEPLLYEDFSSMPVGITTCSDIISSAGDNCFDPGDLIEGFSITAGGNSGVWLLVAISTGQIGNTIPFVGANSFPDYNIVNFPDNNVKAIGHTIYNNSSNTVQYRIFDTDDNLIDTVVIDSPAGVENFFGIISDVEIGKVELEGDAESGELIGNLIFGICEDVISIEDNLYASVSIYPNPSQDIISISVPSGVEIENVIIYDLLGKNSGGSYSSGEINISQLSAGVYILSVETTQGIVTKKIVKK